jgi:hypothetical protein
MDGSKEKRIEPLDDEIDDEIDDEQHVCCI